MHTTNRHTPARIFGLFLVGVAAACDPILGVNGVVRSQPDLCDPSAEPIAISPPVANAKMTLRCNDRVVLEAMSDDSGKFGNATAGFGSAACVVRVEKAGYLPREYKLMDLCTSETGKPEPRKESGPCLAHLVVELTPAPEK